jgi:NAD-dependent dihydropyrimidine dehydrogenase PreA subunit
MDFKPRKIPAIRFAIKRGLYPNYKFQLVGMDKLPHVHFRKPWLRILISRALSLLREKPIVVDEKKCIQCGLCARKCPAKAIHLDPFPIINKRKCIRCFCCMEICPKHALSLGKNKKV